MAGATCGEQRGSPLTGPVRGRIGTRAVSPSSSSAGPHIGLVPVFLKRKLGAERASVALPRSLCAVNGGVGVRISMPPFAAWPVVIAQHGCLERRPLFFSAARVVGEYRGRVQCGGPQGTKPARSGYPGRHAQDAGTAFEQVSGLLGDLTTVPSRNL